MQYALHVHIYTYTIIKYAIHLQKPEPQLFYCAIRIGPVVSRFSPPCSPQSSGVHTRSKKRQATTPTAASSTSTSSTGGTLGTPPPTRSRSTSRRDAGGSGTGKRGLGRRGEGSVERGGSREGQQPENEIGGGAWNSIFLVWLHIRFSFSDR